MPENLLTAIVILAATGCGLVAGVFFAFSTFIMPALARLPIPSGIRAMQSINVTVLTPWFLSLFGGTALLSAVAGLAGILEPDQPAAALRLAGTLLYLLGVIGITGTCNVPRNEALENVDPESDEGSVIWQRYLNEWTAWNTIRTIASVMASVAFVAALMTR